MDDALPSTETPLIDLPHVSELLENSPGPQFGKEEVARLLANIGGDPDLENTPSPDTSKGLLSDTRPSQSQSYPSLAMSRIVSIQTAPQHQHASSQVIREASAPSQITRQLQPAPLLAMSKILVIFQTASEPQTSPSLAVFEKKCPWYADHNVSHRA
jgi:hypothetical protein